MQKLKFEPIAIVFDFDGVLVDSIPAHMEAWREATKSIFGLNLDDFIELESLMGKATHAIAKTICAALGDHAKIKDAAERLRLEKSQQVIAQRNRVKLMPHVNDFLAFLNSKKIPFSIGSNAPRDFLKEVITENHLKFDIVLGTEDADRPKPAPDLFLRCAQLMKIPVSLHERIIVFEDSTHGLHAAVQAGMFPVGVSSMHEPEILIEAGAKDTCKDFSEVMNHWHSVAV